MVRFPVPSPHPPPSTVENFASASSSKFKSSLSWIPLQIVTLFRGGGGWELSRKPFLSLFLSLQPSIPLQKKLPHPLQSRKHSSWTSTWYPATVPVMATTSLQQQHVPGLQEQNKQGMPTQSPVAARPTNIDMALGGNKDHRYLHSFREQHGSWTSSWPPAAAEPWTQTWPLSAAWTTDTNMDSGCTMGTHVLFCFETVY